MKNIETYKFLDENNTPENPVILTGFRPSAPKGDSQSTSFTLGHFVQIQQLKNLSNELTRQNKSHEIFCIIADMQGFLDCPTSAHLKKIKNYTRDYLFDVCAMTHDLDNTDIFQESQVYKNINRLSHYLQMNLDYDHIDQETQKKLSKPNLEKHRKIMSQARLKADFYDQAAHGMGVSANIIPAGENQMKPFGMYNLAIKNMIESGFSYPFTKNIIGVLAEGYLLGIDGKKMSTSKGNIISMDMKSEDIDKKLAKAHNNFFESVIVHFGEQEHHFLSPRDKKEIAIALVQKIVSKTQRNLEYYKDNPYKITDILYKGNNKYEKKSEKVLSHLDKEYDMKNVYRYNFG